MLPNQLLLPTSRASSKNPPTASSISTVFPLISPTPAIHPVPPISPTLGPPASSPIPFSIPCGFQLTVPPVRPTTIRYASIPASGLTTIDPDGCVCFVAICCAGQRLGSDSLLAQATRSNKHGLLSTQPGSEGITGVLTLLVRPNAGP